MGKAVPRLVQVLCLSWLGAVPIALAHPGGLDRNGCHTDRKTGQYHCHRAAAPANPPAGAQQMQPARAGSPPARPVPGRAYANCAEARAAGAAPVRRGDPGYGAHLDRDNDGTGCE